VGAHELLALRGFTEDLARFRLGADEIPSRSSVRLRHCPRRIARKWQTV